MDFFKLTILVITVFIGLILGPVHGTVVIDVPDDGSLDGFDGGGGGFGGGGGGGGGGGLGGLGGLGALLPLLLLPLLGKYQYNKYSLLTFNVRYCLGISKFRNKSLILKVCSVKHTVSFYVDKSLFVLTFKGVRFLVSK